MTLTRVILAAGALAALALCGCGSSHPPVPSAQDQQAANGLGIHEAAWTRAYDRWDSAYRHGRQRAVFFRVVGSTYPTLAREADSMYKSAIGVSDPGLRGQYLELAKNFLSQTSAINLVDDAITRRDVGALRSAIRELDSSRRAVLGLAESFVSYFQRRYGFNPFAPGHG